MYKAQEEAVIATAMWWGDKIFNTLLNKDNGDENPMTFMLSAMASIHAEDRAFPDNESKKKARAKFEAKLIELLTARIENYGENGVDLSCDYAPCEMLVEAMNYADASLLMAPWKSNSYIKGGNAFGKCGYGREYQKII